MSNLAGIRNLEQKLIAEAVHDGGRIDPDMFLAKYGKQCPLPGRYSRDVSPLRLIIAEENRRYYIPQEVSRMFKVWVDKPAASVVNTVDEIPAVYQPPKHDWRDRRERPVKVFESEGVAPAELGRVLKLVQADRVMVVSKSKRPTEAAVKVITGTLAESDFELESPEDLNHRHYEPAGPIRAQAWGVLAQQCGWANPKGNKLALTAEGKQMLTSLDIRRYQAGVGKFLNDGEFDEFNRITHIRGQSGKAKRYMSHPQERKASIVNTLRLWPVNKWIAFDEAYRFVFATGNGFKVTEDGYCLYFAEARYGSLGGEQRSLNRQYLRAFVFESLATLGLVDVVYVYPHHLWPELDGSWGTDDLWFCGPYDGLLYIRLNALGAYCLGVADSYEIKLPARPKLFKILPNRELVLTGNMELPEAERAGLSLFAKSKSKHVWEIDQDCILNHLESGGAFEDIFRWLNENTINDVPPNIITFLEDVKNKAQAVTGSEEAVLIEIKDNVTAALIAHDPGAGKYCRMSGDRCLVVPRKNQRAFKSAMKKLGYIIII